MRLRPARILAIGLIAPLSFTIVGTSPGYAQLSASGAGGAATGIEGAAQRNLRGARQGEKPAAALPPVLPGTKSAPEAAAPTVSPADLSPTDALFDAINRGDATAARDAINRGANMDGHNVLGLTPLELSIDLGRNDISFLLLSMRGDAPASSQSAQKGADRNAKRGADQAVASVPRANSRSRIAAASAEPPAEPVVVTPRLYSGNGGTPIPAAGFLGFDDRRSVR
jgi:hypothetical protein